MSDINTVVRLIDSAGTHLFSLRYLRKDGSESSGVFHAQTKNFTSGGHNSTEHIPEYINLFNVQKKRWSKVNAKNILEAKINGQTYKFS